MHENINIPDSTIQVELTFRNLCLMHMQQLTNFPYIERDFDALTDYELLCLVVKYLNDVITNSNEQNTSITNLYNAFLQLQTYMNNSVQELEDAWNDKTSELEDAWTDKTTELEDAWTDKTTELETAFNNLQTWINNYFDNLDVQEEIDNKLDEMLEQGVLEQIIEQFIQSTAIWCFDTVNDMKNATNLIDGSFAKTFGYYSINDGGGANYKIRTKTADDVIDNGSIIEIGSTLVAELNVNQSINIKQFGAKGNGVDLDDVVFANALNYIKNSDIKVLYFNDGNYLLSTKLSLPSGKYIGLGNATLTETNSTDEVFITNEHFLNYDYQDEIEIKDLTIVKTTLSGGSLNGKRCFRFACTNNLHMDNITMRSNVDSQFAAIDLYSYNTNALIENCKVYKTGTVTATSLVAGYAVREYSETHTTKNISLINCLIDKDGIDESLWISGWFGNVEDVYVNNLKIYDRTNSEGASTSYIDRCSNVTIENSYIYKQGNGYRLMQIGVDENHHERVVDNLFIRNNIFEIENSSNTNTFASFISVDRLVGNKGVFIENNKFYYDDSTTKIGCFILINSDNLETIYSKGNIFRGYCNRLGYRLKNSYNDTLIGNCDETIFHQPKNIKGFKNIGTTPYLYKLVSNSNVSNVTIEDTNYTGTRVFQNNGSTITVTNTFRNCNLDDQTAFCTYYGGSADLKQTVNLINCNITHFPITTSDFEILNFNNLTLNNVLVKGIPTDQHDRNSCPIGTVLFSNTATKSIVRKTSDGSSTTNWEEI